METIIKTLAEHLNVSEDIVRKALGAVLVFLKDHLPDGLVSQLQQALPASEGLASDFEANKSSGGLLGMVTGVAGNLLSGHTAEASKLTSMLSQAGLSMDQVGKFLPKALELLKDHVPPDVYDKIISLVPGSGATPVKA